MSAVRWRPRGIGNDYTPGCLACPGTRGDVHTLHANLAAFVDSRADGEEIVDMFWSGAYLDYRPAEPGWIQVKVGACARHADLLETLEVQWYLGAREVRDLLHARVLRDARGAAI